MPRLVYSCFKHALNTLLPSYQWPNLCSSSMMRKRKSFRDNLFQPKYCSYNRRIINHIGEKHVYYMDNRWFIGDNSVCFIIITTNIIDCFTCQNPCPSFYIQFHWKINPKLSYSYKVKILDCAYIKQNVGLGHSVFVEVYYTSTSFP